MEEDYKKKYEEALERAKVINSGTNNYNIVTEIFPELKESEDERIRKEIICYLDKQIFLSYFGGDIVTFKKWIAWLEKQDPKKHEEELEKAYRCADEVQYRKGYEDAKREIENQNEQKTTDEVKPKFKVGDWIVSETSNLVYRVDSILFPQSKCYYLSYNGGTVLVNFADEKNYHLWTIQDAKDGDVLAFDDAFILIFKGITDLKLDPPLFKKVRGFYFRSYVNVDFLMNVFEQGSFCCDIGHSCHPATKEQCDLLFSKMKEAGYEWDNEKKELKKIEQEQMGLPNGEDYGIDGLYHAARILEKTLGGVEGYQSDDGILEHRCAIEAVKRLYKQKLAWSEEDEKKSQLFLAICDDAKGDSATYSTMYREIEELKTWLKSLKERYGWKPSNEQIESLKEAVDKHWEPDGLDPLYTLYQDLKKLKGE